MDTGVVFAVLIVAAFIVGLGLLGGALNYPE
jgi:hypothetical protein